MSESFYPLNPALEAAFKDSDLLVEEVDLAEMLDPTAQMSDPVARHAAGRTSRSTRCCPPRRCALVQKTAGDLGDAGGPLMRFKPWMLAIALQGMELLKAGFDPALGLDQHFYDQAKAGGKSVQGLETVEFQISRFDGMTHGAAGSDAGGDAEGAGDGDGDGRQARRRLEGRRRRRRSKRIALADLKSDPLMYQRLLVERNKNWMPKIEALFARRGRALVVVGAAHLVGPRRIAGDAQGEGLHGRTAVGALLLDAAVLVSSR